MTEVVVQDLLIMLTRAGLDRSTRHLPVGQPAGRVGPKGDVFLGFQVGRVPLVFVDLAAGRDYERLRGQAGVERVRGVAAYPIRPGVFDLPALGGELGDVGEAA